MSRRALRGGVGLVVAALVAGCGPQEPGAGELLAQPVEPVADYARAHGGDPGTVARVVDGDTFVLDGGGEVVRLLSADAPELGRRSTPADDDCGAQLAADGLGALLPPGTPVVVARLEGEPDRDRYGRRLAVVSVLAGPSEGPASWVEVSPWLVEHGFARVYEAYPTSQTAGLREQQQRAQAARAGIWGVCP